MLMFRTVRAVRFLFVGPLVLLLCFVINWMTFDGQWWVKWVALGIGIAWILSLFRVLRTAMVVGGLAALATYLSQRKRTTP